MVQIAVNDNKIPAIVTNFLLSLGLMLASCYNTKNGR